GDLCRLSSAEPWRAFGCEPQTTLCGLCLSSNAAWLLPAADRTALVPLFNPPHRSVAQIGAVKVGRAQTIGRPHLWRLPDRIDTESLSENIRRDYKVFGATTGLSTSSQPSALCTLPARRAQRSRSPNWLNTNSG